MDEVFDKYYKNPTEEFHKLIYDFCVKDDKDLKNYFIKIATKIDAFPNKDEYISNYMETYFQDSKIEECIKEYENLLLDKINLENNIKEFDDKLKSDEDILIELNKK